MYYEDFTVGYTKQLGTRMVSKEDILEFSRNFDPLPIHTDEAAAADSPFGGLIASGLHTISIASSIIAREFLPGTSMLAGSGFSKISFLKPVRPADTLQVGLKVTRMDEHPAQASLGVVRVAFMIRNQLKHLVATGEVDYLMGKKPVN